MSSVYSDRVVIKIHTWTGNGKRAKVFSGMSEIIYFQRVLKNVNGLTL